MTPDSRPKNIVEGKTSMLKASTVTAENIRDDDRCQDRSHGFAVRGKRCGKRIGLFGLCRHARGRAAGANGCASA